jgi:DHA1 family tetracycline resistance protein-like MFS transporter
MTAPQTTIGPEEGISGASRGVLLVVFATILIDFVGYTVLIPVLPLYAERLGATPIEIAAILTVYALAQLLFLPAWGWVSDRYGRRPVILASLLGTAGSFVLLAASDGIGMIYAARILAGFFAASIGTAQAVVTDVTTPSDRARGMGVIGAAFGAGMVLGPMIGGLMAQVGPQAPFYSVAALALANLAVAWLALPESRRGTASTPAWKELRRALVPTPIRLVAAVHERRIGLFLYLFFHLFTAFAVLEALTTLYASVRFGKQAIDIGLLFMWIGVVLIVTQGILLRRLVALAGEARLVAVGVLTMAAGLAGVALAPSFEWFYAVGSVVAFGNGITFPAFTSLYSKACQAENAGELLGQSQAMATTGRIVGPMVGGWLMESVSLGTPFLAAGALMLLALGLFYAMRDSLLGSGPT